MITLAGRSRVIAFAQDKGRFEYSSLERIKTSKQSIARPILERILQLHKDSHAQRHNRALLISTAPLEHLLIKDKRFVSKRNSISMLSPTDSAQYGSYKALAQRYAARWFLYNDKQNLETALNSWQVSTTTYSNHNEFTHKPMPS